MNKHSHKTRIFRIALYLFTAFSVLPYLWMVATAFKSRLEITASPPKFLFMPTFENFSWSFNGQHIIPLFGNTIIVAVSTTIISLILGVPVAHFIARHETSLTKRFFLFILLTRIAPPIALSLPFFIIFSQTGLRGSYLAVIVIHTVFNLPFVVWLMKSFFSDIPIEVEMSAQVDGRTRLGAFINVVLPLAKAGIGIVALFTFISSWNEYMMASLLSSSQTRPVTPALPGFIAQATTSWGAFCVVGTLSSLPILLLIIFSRHFLARGMTAGLVDK